jgi:hypothetical protein
LRSRLCTFFILLLISGHIYSQTFEQPSSFFYGTHSSERVGYHLHTAGDVNADGFDDFLIGTFHNRKGGYNAGAVYLILGKKTSKWERDISLNNADVIFHGDKGHDAVGYCVAGGGDINGDGYDDMLIGAPAGDNSVTGNPGHLYIMFGRSNTEWWGDAFNLPLRADASFDGENGHVLFGMSAAIIGDLNDDGYDDIICSAPYSDYGTVDGGKVYVILGRADGWERGMPLTEADASFYGSKKNGLAGYSVDGAGDVDKDGIPDFIIGARGEGKAYLFFGRREVNWGLSAKVSSADVVFSGERYGNWTGWRVSRAGDVNADGYGDMLISAPLHGQRGKEKGKIYLVLGRSKNWRTSLSEADASFYGEYEYDQAGWDVQDAGDIDGDGYDDFLIGAWYNDCNGEDSGKMYLIHGRSAGWQRDVPLTDLHDAFCGENKGDFAGFSVATGGDVNADGMNDIIVSETYSGEAYRWGGKIILFLNPYAPPPEPDLELSRSELNFEEDIESLVVQLSNIGGKILHWEVFPDSLPGWVRSVMPESGSLAAEEIQSIRVKIDRQGLDDGEYSGKIIFESNGGREDVQVMMRVVIPPELHISTGKLDFSMSRETLRFYVMNKGKGVLEWSIPSITTPWIASVSSMSGALTHHQYDAVEVSVDREGLFQGTYTAVVPVTSNGGIDTLNISLSHGLTQDYEIRINVGGERYVDADSNVWLPDRYYDHPGLLSIDSNLGRPYGHDGGVIVTVDDSISQTADDILYQQQLTDVGEYHIDLANGHFDIVLHFADIHSVSGEGFTPRSIFDIYLENVKLKDSVDIFQGIPPRRASTLSFCDIKIKDGVLDFMFVPRAELPMALAAIEVRTAKYKLNSEAYYQERAGLKKSAPAEIDLTIHPNPFNQSAMIRYNLSDAGDVLVQLYDIRGRIVDMNEPGLLEEGTHYFNLSMQDSVPTGVYFCRVMVRSAARTSSTTIKVMYLK